MPALVFITAVHSLPSSITSLSPVLNHENISLFILTQYCGETIFEGMRGEGKNIICKSVLLTHDKETTPSPRVIRQVKTQIILVHHSRDVRYHPPAGKITLELNDYSLTLI